MICRRCNRNKDLPNTDLCRNCFIEVLEKKVRKKLRINKPIAKGDRVLVIGDTAGYFIKKIIKDPKIYLFFTKITDNKVENIIIKNRINKVITEHCLDDKIHDNLELFFNSNHKSKGLNYITIFDSILLKDLNIFANIKNLDLTERKKDEIDLFLDNVEKKHKGMKHSYAKSIEVISW